MSTSLSAVLVTVLSQLVPVAEWLADTGDRFVSMEEPADLGEPVAVVQVDVLPDSVAAQQLVAKLELLGDGELEVFVEIVPSEDDYLPPSFAVNVGPFDSFETAERVRAQLEAADIEGFVRELEPALGC